MKITLDIETFSRCDLKASGLAAYAEHDSTDILCACWAFDDGPVSAWVPQADLAFLQELEPGFGSLYGGNEVPKELRTAFARKDLVYAWNNPFERCVLNGAAGRRYDFPKLEIAQMRCSMANARVHGLPGSLEEAALAVRSPIPKRKKGVAAMRYLCKPRKDGSRPMLSEERQRYLELVPYCADDVRAEREVDKLVPPMTEAELAIWQMDQEFNDRGVLVDLTLCDNMEVLIDKRKTELEALCKQLTHVKPSQNAALAAWIRSHGFPELENLQADTIVKALQKDLPENVKTVLKLYSTYNAKAATKYAAFRRSVCRDGRVRHMFMFYGAGTGRWSAHHLQNLARPVIQDQDTAIAASDSWDLDWIRFLYPGVDPMKVFSSCVRGALIAAPGNELVFPDFAGIEARYNAWMFGEEWKLKAYRDYDAGVGANLYCVVYGQLFHVDPKSPEGLAGKPIGKVVDLSMGYEGGVGAFVKMAAQNRVDLKKLAEETYPTLDPEVIDEATYNLEYAKEQGRLYNLPVKVWVTIESLKILWRRSHPRIVKGWRQLKDAAINAVANPGQVQAIPNGRVLFKMEDRWLIMRLPSGRKLWYFQPEIKTRNGSDTLYYTGVDTKTRRWQRTSTYGGALCNNETQGGCRDLLVRAKRRMRKYGLPLIGSVHDEPLLEVREGSVSDAEITRLMCEDQTWDEGLPLAVEVHRGIRYRK